MNPAPYEGLGFACACGSRHVFSAKSTTVMAELGGMRLVLLCPQKTHATCVKIHGHFHRHLESEFGVELPPLPEFPLIGDAAPGSDQEYCPFLADDVRNQESRIPFHVATSVETGPDGKDYWVCLILGYSHDEASDEVSIKPKNSFTRLTKAEIEAVHTEVVQILGNRPMDQWADVLPVSWPPGGLTESVKSVLQSLAKRVSS